jgi:hypothetical protein
MTTDDSHAHDNADGTRPDDTRPALPLEPEPGTTAVAPATAYLPATGTPTGLAPYSPAPARRTPRMRTLVLGLVLAAVSATTLVQLLSDVNVDGGAVALGVILVAGVLLVAGGVASAARDTRTAHDRT